ncbi:hypothetical protein AAFF_G00360020 [Aldrovandia affinis]|uniref:Uncharacterized protein n=1 Tax=Aldrovandia affinis TaxID=143900 RepID=A0AAD7SKC5_9TELE|nr:hypothetical protein AAFF_G00360020 [Aldrovandia affinis]
MPTPRVSYVKGHLFCSAHSTVHPRGPHGNPSTSSRVSVRSALRKSAKVVSDRTGVATGTSDFSSVLPDVPTLSARPRGVEHCQSIPSVSPAPSTNRTCRFCGPGPATDARLTPPFRNPWNSGLGQGCLRRRRAAPVSWNSWWTARRRCSFVLAAHPNTPVRRSR